MKTKKWLKLLAYCCLSALPQSIVAKEIKQETPSANVAKTDVAQFYFAGQFEEFLKKGKERNFPLLLKGVALIEDKKAAASIIGGQC